jgi:polyisoprenoid-binding protein YceI
VTPILLALLLSQAPQARIFALDAAQSHVKFHLDHPLHKVDGQAKQLEAKAQLSPDGQVKAMARAQVAALDTGDGNRDANLRAVMEADRFPYVILKGTGQLAAPATFPATTPILLDAEVDVHGVKQPLKVPLEITFPDADTARIHGTFDVSLEAHHVERPSLLFKKVSDATKVTIDLVLRAERR